jgi:hypothetical protein
MKPSRRRRFAIAWAGVLTLGLPFLFAQVSGAPPARPGPGAAPFDLNGYWTFQDKGQSATILIVHDLRTNKFEGIFQRGDLCVEHEGRRDYYIKGKFDPVKIAIEGVMSRCTINAELHKDCPNLKLWVTTYTAEGDTGGTSAPGSTETVRRFRGTYAGEHYDKDPATGKYKCSPTRQDESFILTRVQPLPGGGAPAPPGPLPGEAPAPPSANPLKQVWDSIWGKANVDEKIWDRKHDGPEGPSQ